MKSEELIYYAKLILLVVILGAISYGIIRILQLDAVQAQIVILADILGVIGWINSGRRAVKKEDERRANLKANGIKMMADVINLELGMTTSFQDFIAATHYLSLLGRDPLTGEEKVYKTHYYGPNEEPDLKKIPKKMMVYVDPNNSDNYFIDIPYLD